MTDDRRSATTPAWIWGGGLLLASAVLPLITGSVGFVTAGGAGGAVFAWIGMLAFAASMVVFALGLGGRGSVVARRPAGMTALIALAAITPIIWVLTAVFPYSDADPGAYAVWGYADAAVRFGAALVAVVAVGRARVVPPPWNWAPAWGLAAVVGTAVLAQVSAVAIAGRPGDQETLLTLFAFSSLVAVVVPSLLGILAIVLGSRAEPRATVPVYPPRA
ncbi:hypothetical protein [Microbacterium sp. T2.11-28]|uniref:hypothetical protein n=1 Tax=Microbacterium sp. T2.11-28 TaxID=3041169 RepID=UPI0024774600|nr:hypothetical protein [Microbacterium sp. T2.11-28]CAI9388755.1 hypothetical protein MICABA_03146 [Microbacterium sp. T2.11-28]